LGVDLGLVAGLDKMIGRDIEDYLMRRWMVMMIHCTFVSIMIRSFCILG
jgi:hypothetical protein